MHITVLEKNSAVGDLCKVYELDHRRGPSMSRQYLPLGILAVSFMTASELCQETRDVAVSL